MSIARETVQVIQEAWSAVGLKATIELLDLAPVVAAFREGHFDAGYGGYTYRFDPNDFYARNLHSQSEWSRGNSCGTMSATIAWWKKPNGRLT